MKIRKFITKVVAVSALTVLAVPAQASHSWSIYHWARQANPLPLEVVDSVTGPWQIKFDESIDDWNAGAPSFGSVLALTPSQGAEDSKARKRCTTINGKMRVCNASYGRNGWLGLASINLDGDSHITKGVAKLNDSYSFYWNAEGNEGERYSVMCQEIGHVFGLDHTSTDGSDQNTCMDYSDDTSPDKPNNHDFEQLIDIYHVDESGVGDSYNSYDDGGSTGGDTCNAPPGKGCNKNRGRENAGEVPPMGIRVHGNARFETWVASDGRGGYWIHHVILAPHE